MSEFDKFHFVIHDRITSLGAQYFEDYWWEKEIAVFSDDSQLTVAFIKNECTDEELWWLGEVYEDIIEKMQDVRILNALKERAEEVQDSKLKEDILSDIQDAERFLIHNT